MKRIKMNGGKLVADVRLKAGVTQEDLAKRVRITQKEVSAFEHTADPRLSTIATLLDALGYELVPRTKAGRS